MPRFCPWIQSIKVLFAPAVGRVCQARRQQVFFVWAHRAAARSRFAVLDIKPGQKGEEE